MSKKEKETSTNISEWEKSLTEIIKNSKDNLIENLIENSAHKGTSNSVFDAIDSAQLRVISSVLEDIISRHYIKPLAKPNELEDENLYDTDLNSIYEWSDTLIDFFQTNGDKLVEKRLRDGKLPPIGMGRGQSGDGEVMNTPELGVALFALQRVIKRLNSKRNKSETYDSSKGNRELRIKAASYLNELFGFKKQSENLRIKSSEEIIFSTGSLEAMKGFASILKGKIAAAFPYYINYDKLNKMYPINVLGSKGFRFTSDLLEKELDKHPGEIEAVLFNDPNNPFGTKLTKKEIRDFVKLLYKHPDIKIAFDVAYFGTDLTNVFAPAIFLEEANKISPEFAEQLKNRTTIFFSGTKIAGLFDVRPSATISFSKNIAKGIASHITGENLHSSIYAAASEVYIIEGLLATNRIALAKSFYGQGLKYVSSRLKGMGAMPREFEVQGGLFTVGFFGELMGQSIPKEAEMMVGKGKIDSNLKLAASLMTGMEVIGKDGKMEKGRGVIVIPVNPDGNDGMMRFFCGVSMEDRKHAMDEMGKLLYKARKETRTEYDISVNDRNLQKWQKNINERQHG